MITAARRVAWATRTRRRPGEHIDDMRAVLVHHHRGALMVDVVGTPADQSIALRFEVGDCRRDVGVACEPRLNGVLVGGHYIDQMRRHQRAHMRTHQLIAQGTDETWNDQEKYDARRDRGGADAAQGSAPEPSFAENPSLRRGPPGPRVQRRCGAPALCQSALLV